MRRLILISLFLVSAGLSASSQKYISRSVEVSFLSETPIENIEAFNNQVSSILDLSTGEIVFQVPIRGFHFENALMEEHFNENYMDLRSSQDLHYKVELRISTTIQAF